MNRVKAKFVDNDTTPIYIAVYGPRSGVQASELLSIDHTRELCAQLKTAIVVFDMKSKQGERQCG
jgi:hypothetical protein